MKITSILLLSIVTFFASCSKSYDSLKEGLYADIETSKGNMIVKLEFEKVPNTVANFVTLAEGKNPFVSEEFKGKPFYDGLKFHRVIADFMIQGGDPNGDGSGGPGYKFKDEFHPDLRHSKAGILSMANAGPSTNGSQFFITHKETPWLDNMHTVFGEVVEGLEIINTITADDVIEKITIIRIGNTAKKFDAVKIFKNYYSSVAKEIKEAEEKAKQIIENKAKEITTLKATGTKTKSGLIYQIIKKGGDKKPSNGTQVNVNYAGYLENGQLFDTSYEDVAKLFGKFNQQRAQQGGYTPIPSTIGNLQFIPGFIEGINMMNFGDKLMLYIPSELGYGQEGAGDVIPPNANIVFEVELLEFKPTN
ncbi:cyclophilin family peptidyl-prolyl cis-trans isomerase [Flavobacterium aquaticum]|uniref:peptidylprolyl isomerase n=1 Tax=Flavobacterium aquaticum TaxID=1236486 RepID=A0A327YQI6_9FLAO|nr:peptidylprolyl isomerase [Flavobacterium aquaticum]RAK22576.1 cyclophilin family peptidyl-prolyl cis-trans isomerase [Flavobacterium aquaticum]